MSLNLQTYVDKLTSHAETLGVFDRVNGHEPKSAPGAGITAAFWVDSVEPISAGSGLAATAGRVALNARVYTSMLQQPEDLVDPRVVEAVDLLLAAYSGDFELGGSVRNVDLLGAHGAPLSAKAGYLNQDGKLYRVMTVVIPLIVNDVWSQVP